MQTAEAARLHHRGIGEGCRFGEGKQAGGVIDYNSNDSSSVGGDGRGLGAGNCNTSSLKPVFALRPSIHDKYLQKTNAHKDLKTLVL